MRFLPSVVLIVEGCHRCDNPPDLPFEERVVVPSDDYEASLDTNGELDLAACTELCTAAGVGGDIEDCSDDGPAAKGQAITCRGINVINCE